MFILAYQQWELREQREREVHREALRLALLTQGELKILAGGIRDVLAALAVNDAVTGGDPEACRAQFGRMGPLYSYYVGFAASHVDGQIYCSSAPPPYPNIADRPYFRRAVAEKSFSVGEYTVSRTLGQAILPFAFPVLSPSGEVTGVVSASLRLDWLDRQLWAKPLPEGASLLVADRERTVLVRRPDPGIVGKKLPDDRWDLWRDATPGTRVLNDLTGQDRVFGFVPAGTDGLGLFVNVGLNRDAALADADRFGREGLIFLLVVAGAAWLATWFGGRAVLVMPLRNLQAVAQQWRDGVHGARADVAPSITEIAGLARSFNEMADAVEERDARLREVAAQAERARAEAERANATKTAFLAAVSHDLRQPVQSMYLFAAALSQQLANPRAQATLDHLNKSIDALKAMLDSLLDIARLESGTVEPRVEPFALDDLLDQLDTGFRPVARAKGLDWSVARCGRAVRSDPVLLGRMLRNLVENALKYTDAGRVAVVCVPLGNAVRIEVADTGPGIAPEHRQDIFLEFHQLGNSERDRDHGLGLGLAVVQRLSRVLGHPVEVRSAPGDGAVFSVTVPDAGQAPQSETAGERRVSAGDGRLVVVVDDDALVRAGLTALLREWGYAVVDAGSGEEMVERLRGARAMPAVVIADYRLREGRTGFEVLEAAAGLFDGAVRGVLLTGEAGADIAADAAARGHTLLRKPITPERLREVVGAAEGAMPSEPQDRA